MFLYSGCYLLWLIGSLLSLLFFFFFKQKTAYEMRISDWSSDVCSSDLLSARDAGTTSPSAVNMPLLANQSPRSRREVSVAVTGASSKIGRASCRERVCQYV